MCLLLQTVVVVYSCSLKCRKFVSFLFMLAVQSFSHQGDNFLLNMLGLENSSALKLHLLKLYFSSLEEAEGKSQFSSSEGTGLMEEGEKLALLASAITCHLLGSEEPHPLTRTHMSTYINNNINLDGFTSI